MNLDRFRRSLFKFSINLYKNKKYVPSCSIYFDMNTFQWKNFACEFYQFINNAMIAAGKKLPNKLGKIKSNIGNLNKTYTKLSEIIDELFRMVFFQ